MRIEKHDGRGNVEIIDVPPFGPANKRDPLDHDGDGRKGGSLPKDKRPKIVA